VFGCRRSSYRLCLSTERDQSDVRSAPRRTPSHPRHDRGAGGGHCQVLMAEGRPESKSDGHLGCRRVHKGASRARPAARNCDITMTRRLDRHFGALHLDLGVPCAQRQRCRHSPVVPHRSSRRTGRPHPRVPPARRVARPRGAPSAVLHISLINGPETHSRRANCAKHERHAPIEGPAATVCPPLIAESRSEPESDRHLGALASIEDRCAVGSYLNSRYHHAKVPRSTFWCPTPGRS
jgi:hypothetical protein